MSLVVMPQATLSCPLRLMHWHAQWAPQDLWAEVTFDYETVGPYPRWLANQSDVLVLAAHPDHPLFSWIDGCSFRWLQSQLLQANRVIGDGFPVLVTVAIPRLDLVRLSLP